MMGTEAFEESDFDNVRFDWEREMVEDLESCGTNYDGSDDESAGRANRDWSDDGGGGGGS